MGIRAAGFGMGVIAGVSQRDGRQGWARVQPARTTVFTTIKIPATRRTTENPVIEFRMSQLPPTAPANRTVRNAFQAVEGPFLFLALGN